MAASLADFSRFLTVFSCEHNQQESIIFCNGISNTRASAEASARAIQDVSHTKVTLFYNPTSGDSTVENPGVDSLASSLATYILEEFDRCEAYAPLALDSVRIRVLAHSHGALITDLALPILRERAGDDNKRARLKRCFYIDTFGGVTMISKKIFQNVANYVNVKDMYSRVASDVIDTLKYSRADIPSVCTIAGIEFIRAIALKIFNNIRRGTSPEDAKAQIIQETATHFRLDNEVLAYLLDILPLEVIHYEASTDSIDHGIKTYMPKICEILRRREILHREE